MANRPTLSKSTAVTVVTARRQYPGHGDVHGLEGMKSFACDVMVGCAKRNIGVTPMNKLPDVVDVKFCLRCDCMTWHTSEGRCEWTENHAEQTALSPPLLPRTAPSRVTNFARATEASAAI